MYIFGKNRRKVFIIKYCICQYVDAHSQPPPENIMNESGAHTIGKTSFCLKCSLK